MKTLLIVLFTLMVLLLVIDPVLRTSVRNSTTNLFTGVK